MEKINEHNIHIVNSYAIRKRDFDCVLDNYTDNEVAKHRTRFSLKMEWAVHNSSASKRATLIWITHATARNGFTRLLGVWFGFS